MDTVWKAHPKVALEAVSKALKDSDALVEKQKETLQEKESEISDAHTKIAELQTKVAELQTDLRKVTETLEWRYLALRTGEGALATGRQELERRIKTLEQETKMVEDRRAELDQMESAVEESRQALRNDKEAADKQVEAAEALRIMAKKEGQRAKDKSRQLKERTSGLQEKETIAERERQDLERQKEELSQRIKILDDRDLELQRKEDNVEIDLQVIEDKRAKLVQETQERCAGLQARESELNLGRALIERRMARFQQEVEEILRQNEVKAKKSQAVLQQVMLEKEDLQQALNTAVEDMSTDRDTLTLLERDLRETRSTLDGEIELRQQAEAERESNREHFLNYHAMASGKIDNLERKFADAQAHASDNNRLPAENPHQRESVPPAYDDELQMETESGPTHQNPETPETSYEMQLEQVEALRSNFNEATRKLTYKEQALQSKDGELRALRDKIARLREMRDTERDAKKAAEADVVKLMETLKQQRLKTSGYKKLCDQTTAKAKAEAAKHQTALEVHRQVASEFDNVVRQHDSLMEEKRNLERTMQEGEPTQIALLAAENVKLQETVIKLQETVKNLRASVMTVGAEARQELEKETSTQRDSFLAKINAYGEDNAKLRQDLSHANATVQSLTNDRTFLRSKLATTSSQLQSAMRSRDESPQQYSAQYSDGAQYSDEDEEEDGPDDEHEDSQSGDDYEEEEEEVEDDQSFDGQESNASIEPWRRPPPQERSLYHAFIKKNFPPPIRPAFNDLEPIHQGATEIFVNNSHIKSRGSLHCPKRSLWCSGPTGVGHVLVFAPTHEYNRISGRWMQSSRMVGNVGQTFDFFMNKGDQVYYAGIYHVHSLRTVHPPGSQVPPDVSPAAIIRAAGLYGKPDANNEKLSECFPDGKIKVECFALQCVGFDATLYRALRDRFLGGDNKRKAGSEDLRDGRNKLRKV